MVEHKRRERLGLPEISENSSSWSSEENESEGVQVPRIISSADTRPGSSILTATMGSDETFLKKPKKLARVCVKEKHYLLKKSY